MDNQNAHSGCTHCSCNNPIFNVLKEDLFHPELLSKITAGLENEIEPVGVSQIIYGGTIRPMIDGSTDTVEAIAVHNGKIAAAGTLATVREFMNSNSIAFTERELTGSHTLLPGFIEPHVHIVPTALMLGWLDLSGVDGQDLRAGYDMDWLATQIKQHKRQHILKYDLGGWILGRGVDPSLMPFKVSESPDELNELVTITYEHLDKIEDKTPLLMQSASGHTLYANTPALHKIFEHDANVRAQYKNSFDNYKNETKGQLQEAAGMLPALKAVPKLQLVEMVLGSFEHITQILTEANSRGATFLYDALMTPEFKVLLEAYLALHKKRVRIGAARSVNNIDEARKLPVFTPPTEYAEVYYGNVKVVSDGSNQGLTGYQSEPYCCKPADNHGIFDFPDLKLPNVMEVPEDYRQLIKTITVDKQWPLMIHANGDLAVKYAIDVFKESVKDSGGTHRRNRIEHCSILTPEYIQAMKENGISPSFLIGHVGYWGYAFKEAIFEDKAEKLDLCKSSLDAGLRITLHSDFEVSPLGPLRMMEQSITRIMEADPQLNVLNPAERLTPEQALRAVTTDAAWQCSAENWVGSLAAGYFADFVILEKDPLTMTDFYMNLRNLKVLETWRGGVKVYANETL